MELIGTVSLWLGNMDLAEDLEQLMKVSYNEDGDYIPSEFANCFSIARYDEATREAEFYDEPQHTLEELLEGFSYDDVIIPELKKFQIKRNIEEYNCVVLLYDFKYEQELDIYEHENFFFEFIGSVKYE
ncbi:MAG: immunity 22 family protein [Oscillospiraceae bacterium]|nr:immunity 22 family protein [Oscillospiraceae bacterium]